VGGGIEKVLGFSYLYMVPTPHKKRTLKDQNPELAKQRHPTKNGRLMKTKYLIALSLFILLSLIYGGSLDNGYVLDDKIYYTENSLLQEEGGGIIEFFTHGVFEGYDDKLNISGNRYRPISLLSFKIDKKIDSPTFSHLFNLFIYISICLLIYYYFQKNFKWQNYSPSILSLIFAVHPVHVEVVSNVKSRDELLCVFFALLALLFTVQYSKIKTYTQGCFAFLFMCCALFSKESAVVFVALIPLFLFYQGEKLKNSFWVFGSLLCYLIFRFVFLPFDFSSLETSLMNDSFLNVSLGQQVSTTYMVILNYIGKGILPLILTHDYYPFVIDYQKFSVFSHLILIGGVLFCGITIIRFLLKKDLIALGITVFFICLLPSLNIFYNVGTLMAERFMFSSIIGSSLLMSIFICRIVKINKYFGYVMLTSLLMFYSLKSYNRTFDWQSDLSLSSADIMKSDNSAKCNLYHAGNLMIKSRETRNHLFLNESRQYLNRALELYPDYNNAKLLLGNYHFIKLELDSAFLLYRDCLTRDCLSNMELLANRFYENKEYEKTEKCYEHIIMYNQEVSYELAVLRYRNLKKYDESLLMIKNLISKSPIDDRLYVDAGNIHFMKSEYIKAKRYYLKAVAINDENKLAKQNLILISRIDDN